MDWIIANKKKSAAAFIGILGAAFTLFEQTGWAVLSSEQHQAIMNFVGIVFSFI